MSDKNFGKRHSESGSLFIRAMSICDTQWLADYTNMYWIALCASNLMGTGTGIILEIRPVPDKQTRYFNCLWVEKVTAASLNPSMMYAGIHDTKCPGTEPFYVVGRKHNKSFEKEIRDFLVRVDEADEFDTCQANDVRDLLRRCLSIMQDQ